MNRDLHQEISTLEEEIVNEENKLNKPSQKGNADSISKSLSIIDSDLKYLSILINGAPIEKKEEMNVREFLRIHYEKVSKLSLPA